MKERPILFSGEMVRAILSGQKTQTRRILKQQPPVNTECFHFLGEKNMSESMKENFRKRGVLNTWSFFIAEDGDLYPAKDQQKYVCPFGKVGDRLWVRESIRVIDWRGFRQCKIRYESDGTESDWMDYPFRLKGNQSTLQGRLYPNGAFKEAARTFLEITNIKVERMQDGGDREFWGEEKWNENPWVWVIEFKRV